MFRIKSKGGLKVKKMKKVFAFALALVMALVSFPAMSLQTAEVSSHIELESQAPRFAMTEEYFGYLLPNQRMYTFKAFGEDSHLDSDSVNRIATQRLIDIGFKPYVLSELSASAIESIARASNVIVTSTYFHEVFNGSNEPSLIEITKDMFEEILMASNVSYEPIKIIDESGNVIFEPQSISVDFPVYNVIYEPIKIIDESGNVIFDPNVESGSIAPFVVQNIGGATLVIQTAAWGNTRPEITTSFIMLAQFQWIGMPTFRGSDYFGITRSANIGHISDVWGNALWGNLIYFTRVPRTYVAPGTGGFVRVYEGHPITRPRVSGLRNVDTQMTGFGININVPSDLRPNFMFPNQIFHGHRYTGFWGQVFYEGHLLQPASMPQYMNHWATYIHQRSAFSFRPNLSFGLGVSMSISVTPAASYHPPVIHSRIDRWQ